MIYSLVLGASLWGFTVQAGFKLSPLLSATITPARFSQRTSRAYQFMMTLGRSMQMDLEELIASQADTPANPSRLPGSDLARKMTVTSGLKCCGSWLPHGPVGSLLKTLLVTSTWASTKCYLTWKVKATPANRLLFQLAPSMPRTNETGFGYWPTPTAHMDSMYVDKSPNRENRNSRGLATAVNHRMFPTPTASEGSGGGKAEYAELAMARTKRPSGATRSVKLRDVVKMWPTPTAHLAKETNAPSEANRNEPTIASLVGGQLNPIFVEWLMGYPEGWTDLKD